MIDRKIQIQIGRQGVGDGNDEESINSRFNLNLQSAEEIRNQRW